MGKSKYSVLGSVSALDTYRNDRDYELFKYVAGIIVLICRLPLNVECNTKKHVTFSGYGYKMQLSFYGANVTFSVYEEEVLLELFNVIIRRDKVNTAKIIKTIGKYA